MAASIFREILPEPSEPEKIWRAELIDEAWQVRSSARRAEAARCGLEYEGLQRRHLEAKEQQQLDQQRRREAAERLERERREAEDYRVWKQKLLLSKQAESLNAAKQHRYWREDVTKLSRGLPGPSVTVEQALSVQAASEAREIAAGAARRSARPATEGSDPGQVQATACANDRAALPATAPATATARGNDRGPLPATVPASASPGRAQALSPAASPPSSPPKVATALQRPQFILSPQQQEQQRQQQQQQQEQREEQEQQQTEPNQLVLPGTVALFRPATATAEALAPLPYSTTLKVNPKKPVLIGGPPSEEEQIKLEDEEAWRRAVAENKSSLRREREENWRREYRAALARGQLPVQGPLRCFWHEGGPAELRSGLRPGGLKPL